MEPCPSTVSDAEDAPNYYECKSAIDNFPLIEFSSKRISWSLKIESRTFDSVPCGKVFQNISNILRFFPLQKTWKKCVNKIRRNKRRETLQDISLAGYRLSRASPGTCALHFHAMIRFVFSPKRPAVRNKLAILKFLAGDFEFDTVSEQRRKNENNIREMFAVAVESELETYYISKWCAG